MSHPDEPEALDVSSAFLDAMLAVMEERGRAADQQPRIFVKDATGRYIRVNAAFAADAGLPPDDIVGKVDMDLHPRDLALQYRADEAKIMADGRCVTIEEPYARGGQLRVVQTTKAPVFAADGSPIGIVGLLIDITDEKRREEQAEIHAHLLEVGQRLANLGSWSYRPDEDRFECSDGLMGILGITDPMDVASLDALLAFFEPDGRNAIEAIIAGAPPDHILDRSDFLIRRTDGTMRSVVMRMRVSKGALATHVVGTVQDVTSQRTREREVLRLNRVFRALWESHTALTRSTTEGELIQGVCNALAGQDLFPLAWIGEPVDDPDKRILVRGAAGAAAAYLRDIQVTWSNEPSGQGPSGSAIKTGGPVVVDDIQTSPMFAPWADRAKQYGIRCMAAVPIFADRRVIAVLAVYAMAPGAFGPEEVSLLQGFADDLGYGIRSLRVHSELAALHMVRKRQEMQLRSGMIHTVEALASTLDSRDPYTAGHQSRVADIACRIAAVLDLEAERLEGLRLAAMVHDIGKIKVPLQILAKPTRLTEIEFELIKTHASAGYEILKNLDLPWPIAEMVLQHHEYLDGSGYPNGISGDMIRLESRILTVADIVESMSSARPYRPPLGMGAALREITRLRGSRLDPDAVDACLKIFSEPNNYAAWETGTDRGGAPVSGDRNATG